VYDDLLIAKDWDSELSCYVHHGFRTRAEETLDSLTPLLDKEAEISLCGHSLGGAVARSRQAMICKHRIESYVARLKRFAAASDIQQLPFSRRFMPMKQRYMGDFRADKAFS